MLSPRLAAVAFPRGPPSSRKMNPSFNYFLFFFDPDEALPIPRRARTATASPGDGQRNKLEAGHLWKFFPLQEKAKQGLQQNPSFFFFNCSKQLNMCLWVWERGCAAALG